METEAQTVRPLPLRVNFAWTFAGNVTYALCQWGIVMALAKLGTPEMVGRFALGLAITAPVTLFAGLALRAVQATDARKTYRFGDYVALRLVTTSVALLVILGIVWAGGYGGEAGWVIWLIGLAKAFEAMSDIFYGLFQQHERMDRVATSMMIKGPLSLVALAVAVFATRQVWAGAAALAVAWALVLALYDIPNGAALLRDSSGEGNVGVRWHWPTLFRLARLSFPLGITMMVISLNTNIPRYFVEHYRGERDLGFFAATAYLMVAGTTVVNALGQSASPRLANHYAAGKREAFRSLLVRLLSIGAGLGMAGVLVSLVAGREVLALLYRREYAELSGVLVWVMVAAALAYLASFLGYALTAARSFNIQPVIFTTVALSNALFCLILVPRYGLTGAAWAMGMANGVQCLVSLGYIAVVLRRTLKRDATAQCRIS